MSAKTNHWVKEHADWLLPVMCPIPVRWASLLQSHMNPQKQLLGKKWGRNRQTVCNQQVSSHPRSSCHRRWGTRTACRHVLQGSSTPSIALFLGIQFSPCTLLITSWTKILRHVGSTHSFSTGFMETLGSRVVLVPLLSGNEEVNLFFMWMFLSFSLFTCETRLRIHNPPTSSDYHAHCYCCCLVPKLCQTLLGPHELVGEAGDDSGLQEVPMEVGQGVHSILVSISWPQWGQPCLLVITYGLWFWIHF